MSLQVRGSLRVLACALGAWVAAVSHAQDPDPAARNDEVIVADLRMPSVLVTGSRIRQLDDDTLEPTLVVDEDYLAKRGLTNVADALNETPGFGVGITPDGDQNSYAPGVNFVNLFNLGSNRTLTLINGRRIVTSNPPALFGATPGNQVDLNFVPTVLLDRVDVLGVGGAPTYGSDAIAGVVNVRLKQDFEGLRAFGQYGQMQNGAGRNESLGLVGGWSFAGDRGNLTVSLQHSESDGVLATSIDRFRNAYSYSTNPTAVAMLNQPARTPANDGRVHPDVPFNTGAADGIPNTVLIANRRLFTRTFGGLAVPNGANNLPDGSLRCFGPTNSTCLQFAPNGDLVPYDPGTNFGTGDASGGDGMYLMSTLQLASDLERTSGTASAHFDVTDNVRLFTDVFAYRSEAREIVDQPAYNTITFGGSSGAIVVPVDQPLLSPQARDTLVGLGESSFRLSRANMDLQQNKAHSQGDLVQIVAGATGSFDAGWRQFTWETYVNVGRNEITYYSQQLDRQKFINSLNVVRDGGQLRCSATPGYAGLPAGQNGRIVLGTDVPIADPACMPLDIFGFGRPSPAALDYVASLQRATASIEQQVFNANLGSTLFTLPAGDIEYNVGFEHRRESGDFHPDDFLARGLGRSAPVTAVSGDYDTNEFFGEITVPLFSEMQNDIPGLERLTLSGKARRVDSSVNGAFTAYTTGLEWAPVRDVEFRGNATRSLRAPAIVELYMPVSSLFTQVADPCSTGNLSSGPRPDVRRANCARFFTDYGLPTDGSWTSTAATTATQATSQGDPNLGNETSNAWTAGVVVRPRFAPGVRLAADWVDIRIDNSITRLAGDDLASACFDNADYPNHYCNYFARTAAGTAQPGQITFVQTGYANGSFQSMAGLNLAANYQHDFALVGTVGLGINWFRLDEELRSATGVTVTNTAGQIGSPRDSAQLNLDWQRGAFGAHWQSNYVGPQVYNRTFNADSRDVLEVNADWVHNLSASWQPNAATVVRLAVTNVFDGEPPFPIAVDAFNGNYDFLGRRFSLAVTYDFGTR